MTRMEETEALRARTDVHYNCCQSVLVPFADLCGLDKETAFKLGANFGSGMRHGSTCGAVSGALMVLGLLCEGTTVIRNAERLRIKESDRIEAMETELRACGGQLESEGGTITIHGCAGALHAPEQPLSGHNDHRIVMALAVAAIASGLPALLCGAEAVDKSWPAFWSVLRGLGAKVELNTDKQEEFDIKA